ncbi:hypothetical protein LQ757_15060 [Agromyces sp. SYSU K20354]|uniref:hypothetical protein n=1 Tax=Agromyces cavernae TaxID=2898659 RepID=UPI001E41B6A7|nr:hypothetical protein [Agromyces cavernae]MCD2443597.1 hypothetical protein [Agromyces cavernae]
MTVPAPGVAGRYGMRVRTPELPMAFTFGEFARGAGIAWLVFQLVFPLSYPLIIVVAALMSSDPATAISSAWAQALMWGILGILWSFVFALPWSLGALVLLGGPAAWVLGLTLRRVRSIGVHLVLFAILGLGVGGLTAWLASSTMSTGAGIPYAVIGAVVTAVSVAYGWHRTARRALKDDALFNEQASLRDAGLETAPGRLLDPPPSSLLNPLERRDP